MMAYCTITEVRQLNPKRTYDDSSKPTTTQVEAMIDQVAAEIDTILQGRGLSTPVTTPTEFVNYLKKVNSTGVAALAEMAMFPEAGGPGSSPHGQQLYKIYRDQLGLLREGELPSALEGGAGPRSFFTEHPVTEPEEEAEWREPKFKKNKEF